MKRILFALLMLLALEVRVLALPTAFNNPVFDKYMADPFCWYYNGTYYAIGTGDRDAVTGAETPMAKSKDLQHWEYVGHVLYPADEEKGGNIWAPEVAYDNGTFYLYYHADGNGHGFHIRVATSKSPEGPYHDNGKPLTDVLKNPFAIDSTTFRDTDGKWYMFYATDFLDADDKTFRGTALVMDRLINMTELEGHPQVVMRAHWSWQVFERNRNKAGKVADWYTLEGPTIRKHGGKYYCFYSGGNYQNDSYGVDYLVADRITGPWKEVGQYRGPQIMRSVPGKVIGPGHNSIVSSPDGKQDFIVYHAWNKEMTARQMWVDPIVWTPKGPVIERFAERVRQCSEEAEQKHAAKQN